MDTIFLCIVVCLICCNLSIDNSHKENNHLMVNEYSCMDKVFLITLCIYNSDEDSWQELKFHEYQHSKAMYVYSNFLSDILDGEYGDGKIELYLDGISEYNENNRYCYAEFRNY